MQLRRPDLATTRADLPALAAVLLNVGFDRQDVGKFLDGNYVRVFAASLV